MLVKLIAYALAASSISLSVVIFVRHRRVREMIDERSRLVPLVFLTEGLLILCDLLAGADYPVRLMLDIVLCVLAMMLLVSSMWSEIGGRRIAIIVIAFMFTWMCWYVSAFLNILKVPNTVLCLCISAALSMMLAFIHVFGLWNRIKSVKAVIKSGTVWSWLSLAVDSVYTVMMLSLAIFYYFIFAISDAYGTFPIALVLLFSSCLLICLGVRVSLDSLFVFMLRHERRIVESMKVTNVDTAMDGSRINAQYRELYERVQQFFEKEKPYLKGDLTINDVVKAVYTNKLYISRAISQCTGRNFCQYVNYYRITYSINAFKENPELRIHELANASGFNSVVSFNMAFRLYMGENPSDWCRKEKKRLARRIK